VPHQGEPFNVFAPAKINLFLHVGEKRADGFHALESLVMFARAGDTLIVEPSDGLSLALEGDFAKGLERENDNLVLRAARLLGEHAGVPACAHMALVKNLPVASGIGGGSADAAAALRGLVKLWDLKIGAEALHGIAASLGSDIPACLYSRPCWMEGRGERVTAIADVPQLQAVLVNPGIAVPTGKVFAALSERHGTGCDKPAGWKSAGDLLGWLSRTANDLEAPARAIAPEISDALEALGSQEGCRLARMSGSGATCFGLFADNRAADAAEAHLKSRHPNWWVVATTLG
jgi:4-diphosphocytidyl-2-C-methyl-D-erythritol kinase